MSNFLGARLRDDSTGIVGLAEAVAHYSTGNARYYLQPTAVDNKLPDGVWIDCVMLTQVDPRSIRPCGDAGNLSAGLPE